MTDAAGEPVKVPRMRKPREAPSANGESSSVPPARPPGQPELLSPSDFEHSPSPEAQIETRVISPDVYRAIEKRTQEVFTQPGVPAAAVPPPPPAAPPEMRAADPVPPMAADPAPPIAAEPAAPARGDAPPARENQAETYQAPPGNRYQEQDRRSGQERYPRHQQQQHGQHPHQRHNNQPSQQQHRPYQSRDGQPQRDHQPRGDNQTYNSQPSGQDAGGGDPLVSRVTETQYGEGIVEVSGKGFGFLRDAKRMFAQTPDDVFVTPEVCRTYNLRDGQWVKGETRRGNRGPQLFRLTEINGDDPEKFRDLPDLRRTDRRSARTSASGSRPCPSVTPRGSSI